MFGSHDRLSFSIQAVTHLITPLASAALTLMLSFLWRVVTVDCAERSWNSLSRAVQVISTFSDQHYTWIPWILARPEMTVACAIAVGCTAPVAVPSATWSFIGAAGLWFPVLLFLSESLSIQAHFTDGVLAFGVIVAFLMWIRGMIAAGDAVLSLIDQQP